MREFTREEMEIIARKCGIPINDKYDDIEPKGPQVVRGILMDDDGVFVGPFGNNPDTADVVIRSRAFKDGWKLRKASREKDSLFTVDGNNFPKWYDSWTTAVLEAVLVSGHDTRMEVVG